MWLLQRIDPFSLISHLNIIATVGGGGKTTLAEYLAARAFQQGRRTVITTTTKMRAEAPYLLVDDLEGKGRNLASSNQEGPLRIGKALADGKLTSLSFDEIEGLEGTFDFIVIEADGAKGRPLKLPSAHEPVIPPFSDQTILVAGLDGLGGPVADHVFRWELFQDMAGVPGDALIDSTLFATLFGARAMMKDIDPAKCTIMLNKFDACREREKVIPLAKRLVRSTGVGRVIISSLLFRFFYSVSEV
ncbi:MAG TPA: putative selenium-dependent hydroxylase accessory protein YqeC [Deltaproteobacteria bacterium]|nr:putative selenium-dependent hydroxylase accessory protein YqeC [Deltaproteobacteria bacterium]